MLFIRQEMGRILLLQPLKRVRAAIPVKTNTHYGILRASLTTMYVILCRQRQFLDQTARKRNTN